MSAKPKDIEDALRAGAHITPDNFEASLEPFSAAESTDAPPPFVAHLVASSIYTGALRAMDLPPKEKLLGDFFEEADFGFVYAPRGLGKTWLSLAIADAIAEGRAVGEWEAGSRSRNVLIVDGEMNLAESKGRAEALDLSESIRWLHHEHVYNETEQILNLTDPAQQTGLAEFCQTNRVDVMILDNLSCLFSGIRENDADDWGECVLPWILSFRRLGIAVVIVAHAGRNGEMRGTSKREDQAHWVIKLKTAPSSVGDEQGARFISAFTKNRHSPESRSPSLLWEFSTDGEQTAIKCRTHSGYDAFLDEVEAGVDCQGEIADALGVNKATVSKWTKKAVANERIRKDGRRLLWIAEPKVATPTP